MAVLVQIDGYDPVAIAAVTLRAASHDDPDVCHVGGETWWPALAKLPPLKYDFFDGAFGGQITAPTSSFTLQIEPWPDFGRYQLADARIRITTGPDVGGEWTLRFDGRVTAQPKASNGVASVEIAVDDKWLDNALLATYAGTTGAEGTAALKGQAKPLAIGAPRYAPGKLIDNINTVFQLSSYGPIHGLEVVLERLVRFPAPVADYDDYDELVAADIAAGDWATALAVGMARGGAPTEGLVSFLLSGDEAGAGGYVRRPGSVIGRLAELSGGTGKIDTGSLTALDSARPFNLSLYLGDQATARERVQAVAASVNAVALVSWLGLLTTLSVAIGTPSIALAADGSSFPAVRSVEQIEISAPFKKLAIGAERAWAVHALADVAFTAELIEVGPYDPGKTYREGNIVSLPDGSRWLDIAVNPVTAITPGTNAAVWSVLTPAVEFRPAGTRVFYQDDEPIGALLGDLWMTTPDNPDPAKRGLVYRYFGTGDETDLTYGDDDDVLTWGDGGDALLFVSGGGWVLTSLSGRVDLAGGNVMFLTGAGDPVPVATKINDIWYDRVTGIQRVWDGTAWVVTADQTALNQHTFPQANPFAFNADYQGALLDGQVPAVRPLRRYLGIVDVSPSTDFVIMASGSATASIENTPADDSRGDLTVSNAAGAAVVTVKSSYGGVDLYMDIPVTFTLGAPPATGGGGGGGDPGPPATTGSFASPGVASSYVEAATLSGVTIGSSGTARIALSLWFNASISAGNFFDPNLAPPTDLDFKIMRSVNGGSFADALFGFTSSSATKFYQTSVPKGLQDIQGSISFAADDTGLTPGATVVYRLLTVPVPSTYGAKSLIGSFSASPS